MMGLQHQPTRIALKGASVVALSIIACTEAAFAQQAALAPASEEETGDIVVTAQLRQQRLADVPISVSVTTSEQLERQAIVDNLGLARSSPSLTFQQGTSVGQGSVAMRGITGIAQSAALQPSVALVIDGVPVQRQGEFSTDLVDVDRVEVLTGPQGTLFGKNSTAGVISITTKRPVDEFRGMVELGATTDEEYSLRGMLNVPLSEVIQARVTGWYRDQNPLIKNEGPAPDVVGLESWGFTGKLNFDISDSTSLLLMGGYNRLQNSTYNGNIIIKSIAGAVGALQTAALGFTPSRDDRIATDSPTFEYLKLWNVAAEFSSDLTDQLRFVTIASYRDYKNDNTLDVDGTPYGVNIGQGFSPGSIGYPALFINRGLPRRPDFQHYWSVESRLHYDNGTLQAVAGSFYQKFKQDFTLTTPLLLAAPFAPSGCVTSGLYCYSAQITSSTFKDTTASLFGDATLAVTDQIKLFGGLRYTHEEVDDTYFRRRFLNNAAGFFDPVTTINTAPPVAAFNFTAGTKINNLSGRAGVQFQPTPELNYYASYARGYKGPGADFAESVSLASRLIVDPEKTDAFEVGAKQRFFDGALSFDIALFKQKIKGVQTSAPVLGTTAPVTQLLNAGNLKLKGVEATAVIKVNRQVTFDAGVSYTDSKYDDFIFACYSGQTVVANPTLGQCGAQPGVAGNNQNIKGRRAVAAPKLKYVINANYDGDFGPDSFKYHINLNFTHQSAIQYQLDFNPDTEEPSHNFLSASIGFTSPDDRWEILVYGKNLTNELYYSNIGTTATIGRAFARVGRDYQRYGGIKVTHRF